MDEPKRFTDYNDFIEFIVDNAQVGEEYSARANVIKGRRTSTGIEDCSTVYSISQGSTILAEYRLTGWNADKESELSEDEREAQNEIISSLTSKLTSPERRIEIDNWGNFSCYDPAKKKVIVNLEGTVKSYEVKLNESAYPCEVLPYMEIELDENNTFTNEGNENRPPLFRERRKLPKIIIPFTPDIYEQSNKGIFGQGSEITLEIEIETKDLRGNDKVVPKKVYIMLYDPKDSEKESLGVGLPITALKTNSGSLEELVVPKLFGKLYETDKPEEVMENLFRERTLPEELQRHIAETRKRFAKEYGGKSAKQLIQTFLETGSFPEPNKGLLL
jgi:hypothetical protein